MIQPINDGGPAYPHTTQWDGITPAINHHGISIRDYFAAAALPVAWGAYDSMAIAGDNPNQEIAQAAYQLADAMLKAREAK